MALNLTEDELQLLASLPQSIGSAVAFAGRSGLFGTGKEMFASGQALMAGVKDYPGNELIQAVVPDPAATDKSAELEQSRKTRDWAMARMKAKGIDSAAKLSAQTLEDAREAAQLLDAKVDAATASQYRAWALGVAEKVAMASTEGGFLGFGGTRLSDEEKTVIAQVKAALGA
jgi:hypothetical protein